MLRPSFLKLSCLSALLTAFITPSSFAAETEAWNPDLVASIPRQAVLEKNRDRIRAHAKTSKYAALAAIGTTAVATLRPKRGRNIEAIALGSGLVAVVSIGTFIYSDAQATSANGALIVEAMKNGSVKVALLSSIFRVIAPRDEARIQRLVPYVVPLSEQWTQSLSQSIVADEPITETLERVGSAMHADLVRLVPAIKDPNNDLGPFKELYAANRDTFIRAVSNNLREQLASEERSPPAESISRAGGDYPYPSTEAE